MSVLRPDLLFLDLDGHNDMTLWLSDPERPEYPEALVRECDVRPEVWTLLELAVSLPNALEAVIADHEGNRSPAYAGVSDYVPIRELRRLLGGDA